MKVISCFFLSLAGLGFVAKAQTISSDFSFYEVAPGPFGHNTKFFDVIRESGGQYYAVGSYSDDTGSKLIVSKIPGTGFHKGGIFISDNTSYTGQFITSSSQGLGIGGGQYWHRLGNGGNMSSISIAGEVVRGIENKTTYFVLTTSPLGFKIRAYQSNGSLYSPFGNQGVVTIATTYTPTGAKFILTDQTPEAKFMVAVTSDHEVPPNQDVIDHLDVYRFMDNGALDNSWGTNGHVNEPVTDGFKCAGIAIESTGKVLVVGNSDDGQTVASQRWNNDGTPDNAYGGGGVGVTYNNFGGTIHSLLIDENNNLIFVGKTNDPNSKFLLAGLDVSGNKYTGFTSNTFLPNDPTIQSGTLEKIIIRPNSFSEGTGYSFVVCGHVTRTNGGTRGIVMRLNTNGTINTSFAGSGGIYMPNVVQQGAAKAIVKQDDGKLVAVGGHGMSHVIGGFATPAIARYLSNGELDLDFGFRGGSFIDTGDKMSYYHDVNVLANGKIIAFGQYKLFEGFLVARYNANGTLDNSFDTDGYLTLKGGIFNGTQKSHYGEVDSQGRLVLVGSATTVNNSSFLDRIVMRLKSDGTIDNTFGSNGKSIFDKGTNEEFTSGALYPDDGILAAGHSREEWTPTGKYENILSIVKLKSDGNPDTNFGTDGFARHFISNTINLIPTRVQILSDKKIILTVRALDLNSNDQYLLIKLEANGNLDTSFGTGGIAEIKPQNSVPTSVDGMNVDSNGNILITGRVFSSVNGFTAKYNSNGEAGKVYAYGLTVTPTGPPIFVSDNKIVLIADGARQGFGIIKYDLEEGTVTAVEPDFEQDNKLKVFPNPAREKFSVQLPNEEIFQHSTYRVIDMMGKVHRHGTFPNQTDTVEISTDDFRPGMYLVEVVNRQEKLFRKILME